MSENLLSNFRRLTALARAFGIWNKQTIAKWWLWVPLLFATIAVVERDSRADMYKEATSGLHFERVGVVDDVGIRGRWMQLQTGGMTRRISCEAARPRSRDTDCLPRERFPLKLKVTLTDYHGVWLVISAADTMGHVILPRELQMARLKRLSEFSSTQTPAKVFVESLLLALIPGGGLTLLALRRRRKLEGA